MMHNRLARTAQRLWFAAFNIDLHEAHLPREHAIAVNSDPPMLGHRPLASRVDEPGTANTVRFMKEIDFAWGFAHRMWDAERSWTIALEAIELDRVRFNGYHDAGGSDYIKIE